MVGWKGPGSSGRSAGLGITRSCTGSGGSASELAAHERDEIGGNAQAQPRAAELAGDVALQLRERLEQMLLDLMSLGQRFNWGQLVGFVGQIQDTETLRLLANLVRKSEGQLPALFTAVQLSGKPAQVAAYRQSYPLYRALYPALKPSFDKMAP